MRTVDLSDSRFQCKCAPYEPAIIEQGSRASVTDGALYFRQRASNAPRYLRWFARLFCDCRCFVGVLQSRQMAGSDTLKLGDRAPDFTLNAANRPDSFSLTDILKKGPAVLEFLRGTW